MEAREPGRRKARPRVVDVLLLPLYWVFQIPLSYAAVALGVLLVAGGIVYSRADTSLFAFAGPDFDAMTVSDSFEEISVGDIYWSITFEGSGRSEFSGVVRHVSPIRMGQLRILTHDILIASGEYADPDLVSTSVLNHRFSWRSASVAHPDGSINLLHTVPAGEAIYRQLLELREWDEVAVSGREILVIKAYSGEGGYLGDWRDTGCNTILVEEVSVLGQDSGLMRLWNPICPFVSFRRAGVAQGR